MSYTPAIDVVQIGKQTVFGTAVPPTAKLSAIEECEIQPIQEAEVLKELRGGLAGNYTASLNKGGGEGKIAGALTFEDIGYYLDSILELNTSPTGAGPYVYTRNAAVSTTMPTRRIMTVLKGQAGYDYQLVGAIVNELTVKIESNKPWMFDAALIGRHVDESGSVQALSDRTATLIHANETQLYIDAWGGTIGTTQISSAWFSAELKINANLETVPTIGNQYPSSYRDAPYEGELKIRLEVDTATKAYVTSILGNSAVQKQVRIKATNGTNIAQIDFAGTFKNAPMVDDENGISVFEFEMFHTYNTALSNWLKTSITNSVASLP